MPLVATAGSSSANSYLTLAEADAIADEQGLGRDAQSWLKSSAADKERALVRATSEIDAFVGPSSPTAAFSVGYALDQSLVFPRAIDVDGNGDPLIISNIRLATFYQALYDLHNADVIADADSRRARGMVSFSDDDGSGTLNNEPQVLSTVARRYLASMKNHVGKATLRSVPLSSASSRPTYY